MPETIKRTPDRAQTDKHLEKERRNTDLVLGEQKAAVEADSDRVVDRAREQADVVLQEAREKADRKLEALPPAAVVRAVIDEERELEDRAVEHERATADQSLRQEREQNARDLLTLLPLERISTDRSLRTERVGSDVAVSQRDDVLGIVSHDLRDLLGGIVTSTAALLRIASTSEAGASTRACAELIERHAARMKRLLGDLTDVSSIDAGKLSVTPVRGDLAPVVAEAVLALRGALQAKSISLELPHSEPPTIAMFDADRISQVLNNLIANAIKFTPDGGRIRIEYEVANDMARVSVIDDGQGIPPEFIEVIFERYRQVANAERRGLGLGLFIARSLIEAQRGKIWAESTLGKGTRFTFTLPAGQ